MSLERPSRLTEDPAPRAPNRPTSSVAARWMTSPVMLWPSPLSDPVKGVACEPTGAKPVAVLHTPEASVSSLASMSAAST